MQKLTAIQASKAGLPPGSLVYVGENRSEPTNITVIDYDENSLHEHTVLTPEECKYYLNKQTTTWINLTGLNDTNVLQDFGTAFGIHPLVLEDILHTHQRPRFEDHGDYLFIVLKMLYRAEEKELEQGGEIIAEQISFIIGPTYLITFQEVEGDSFDLIRERIRTSKGRVRKLGADYLAYTLIDAIVDNYFVVLEDIGTGIEFLQEQVLTKPEPATLQLVQRIRSEMIFVRKLLWPLRELINNMDRSESDFIADTTAPYLRDVYEHTVQAIDTVETMRDILSGIMDVYMSSVSNRMSEVMKVLTALSTVFLPLTFVAGVYGMNFRHFPEIEWKYGYAFFWAVIVVVAGSMLLLFRRKKWI